MNSFCSYLIKPETHHVVHEVGRAPDGSAAAGPAHVLPLLGSLELRDRVLDLGQRLRIVGALLLVVAVRLHAAVRHRVRLAHSLSRDCRRRK